MKLYLFSLLISMASSLSAQGPLRFELKLVEKQAKECVATFEYPEILSAETSEAQARINAGILRVLLRSAAWPVRDSGFESLSAYADGFVKGCGTPQTRPGNVRPYLHKRVTIYRYTPPVLSFKCDSDEDDGGAHPFGTTFFINFNGRTGQSITLKDLVKDGSLPKLEALAESRFRSDRNLSPNESLSAAYYTFPGDQFRLNENFGLGEEQLTFFFNAYEIGPGALGSAKIEIRYPILRSIFKLDLSGN